MVKFYDQTQLSQEAQRSLREFRDDSQEHISGELYHNVRLYQQAGKHAKACEWLARSPHFNRDFKQLQ